MSPFCETFFDNVQVPRRNLVGEPNGGWEIAKYLLTHEREMISSIGDRGSNRSVAQSALAAIGADATGRLADPLLRAQIAAFEVDESAFRLLLERSGDLARQGQGNPAFSSLLKYYGAELNKRRYELAMQAAGSDGLEWEGERSGEGSLARTWLRTKANSIEGGTSEVQLNVVAKRILGLPGA
jgi:alkylation response protein AidB-like acyl-CoA dehydrogenase